MEVQPDLNASKLVPIGDVAARFGLRASALRYYEARGLLRPQRVQGRRCYDREQLRRLAFLQIGRQLGMTLDELAEMLNGPEHRWRSLVENQIAVLTAQIERATRARQVLTHSLECTAPNPLNRCPHFIAELDRLAGAGAGAIGLINRDHPAAATQLGQDSMTPAAAR